MTVILLAVPVLVSVGVAVDALNEDASDVPFKPFVIKGLDCFESNSLTPRCMIDVSILTSAGSCRDTVKIDGDGRKNVLSYSLTLGVDDLLL